MYRVITYLALSKELSLENEKELLEIIPSTKIDFVRKMKGEQDVYCNETNVTKEIRSPLISQGVSKVAMYPSVRKELVNIQRALAKDKNVVMDGRDTGTVVLPNAECKIFLTASLEERAKRRYLELKGKGYSNNLESIKKDIAERDYLDKNRSASPLTPAHDAVIIDTTSLSLNEVIKKILKIHTLIMEEA